MVFFVFTRSGYDELVSLLGKCPSPLWINASVLSEEEIRLLYEKDVEVSVFSHLINFEDICEVTQVIDTIKQHHPNQSIWVESPASL